MEIVINEWFLEYFKPETSAENKKMLEEFLVCIYRNNYVLAVREPSDFVNKLNKLSKTLIGFEPQKTVLSRFIANIYIDSKRTRTVLEKPVLPIEVVSALAENNFSSDTYLFEAAITTEEKIIVTTDQKLISRFKSESDFHLITPTAFMDSYCL